MSNLLREAYEAIHEQPIRYSDYGGFCVFCQSDGNAYEPEATVHEPDCIVLKARAWLAANPVGEEPEEWLDKPDSEGRWLCAWIDERGDERMDIFVVHVANLEGYRPGLYTHTKSHVDSFVPSMWKKVIFPELPAEETKP